MKKRIYVSGPISGHDIEERRRAFKVTQMRLSAEGWEVFNPMENGLLASATTNEHMKVDIRHLLLCDTIYMMKGWNHSAGCWTEFHDALAIGMDVIFEQVGSPIRFE